MIDIIGVMKVDESNSERVKGLIACIRSYAFLHDTGAAMAIVLEQPSQELFEKVLSEASAIGLPAMVMKNDEPMSYGLKYCEILNRCKNDYVINFMEDQFMILDNPDVLFSLLQTMKHHNADILKSSFLQIEKNSFHTLACLEDNSIAKIFVNNPHNFAEYQKHYGSRYYIGVNFITTKNFALRFWNRNAGPRPHEYEISEFNPNWGHTCVIPKIEVQAAINDDHGEVNTCLLKRQEKKFWDMYNNTDKAPEKKIYVQRTEPWLTESANNLLQFIIDEKGYDNTSPSLKVLEAGMGSSTIWFLGQQSVKQLFSFEHELNCYKEVCDVVEQRYGEKSLRAQLVWQDRPYSAGISALDPDHHESFDIALIDGRDRVRCLEAAIPLIKPGGVLILDNSERNEYEPGIALLSQWRRIDTYQIKEDKYGFTYPGWCTSFFIKPKI